MSRTRARAWLWALAGVLACVLVIAQTLGLAHRVLHGATGLLSASHTSDVSHALHVPLAESAEPARYAGPTSLFDGHAPGSEPCRLLDQAAHADALVGSAALLPPSWPRVLPQARSRVAVAARATAAYQARGPPAGSAVLLGIAT